MIPQGKLRDVAGLRLSRPARLRGPLHSREDLENPHGFQGATDGRLQSPKDEPAPLGLKPPMQEQQKRDPASVEEV